MKGGDKKVRAEVEVLERIKEALYNDQPARSLELTEDEKLLVRDLHLLTMKPVLYAANVSEGEVANADDNPYVKMVVSLLRQKMLKLFRSVRRLKQRSLSLKAKTKRCSWRSLA